MIIRWHGVFQVLGNDCRDESSLPIFLVIESMLRFTSRSIGTTRKAFSDHDGALGDATISSAGLGMRSEYRRKKDG